MMLLSPNPSDSKRVDHGFISTSWGAPGETLTCWLHGVLAQNRFSWVGVLLVTAWVAVGLACGPGDTDTPPTPVARPTDCPEPGENECFVVVVPETRAPGSARSPSLQLFVVRYSLAGAAGLPPIVLLAGGPGSIVAQELSRGGVLREAAEILGRTVIVLSQRGVPPSTPSLECPSFGAPGGADACFEQVRSEGYLPSSFNTLENAADVRDVIRALGYSSATLYGASYGTRLALTVAREHPEVVESLVLGGATFPSRGTIPASELEQDIQEVLDAYDAWIAERCSTDSRCSAALPGFTSLQQDFEAALARVASGPVTLTGSTVIDAPDDLIGAFLPALYGPDTRAFYLLFLHAIAVDDVEGAKRYLAGGVLDEERRRQVDEVIDAFFAPQGALDLTSGLALGMHHVVNCLDGSWQMDFLEPWCISLRGEVGLDAAAFHRPLSRPAIPTLMLQGRLDPATPALPARRAAEAELSGEMTRIVEWPCGSHEIVNLFVSACHTSIVQAFLRDPTAPIDDSCVAVDCASYPVVPNPLF